MSRSKLSKWLRSGVIKQNIKSTLKFTIDLLCDVCPLKVSSEIIPKSLYDILCNDKVFCEQSKIHTKMRKNFPKPSRPYAVFKKRVYSSTFLDQNDEEQDAIIEPLLNLVEKALNEFLIKNEHMIPSENNVRHKMAHGILIDQKGRWSDHVLQNVAILACDVVTCLGGDYKELYAIKERLDNAIIEKWPSKPTLEVKNKNYENQIQFDSNF
ncbi:6010_t:CDS:2, partial [Gigaspora rosea]